MAKDYYDILGVSKDVSKEEVKKAFRKLAHEHHPDKHGGGDAKFKEINEAYQVLSNEQKRAQYDQFGAAGVGGAGSGSGGFGGQGFGGGNPFEQGGFNYQTGNVNYEDIEDILGSFFGGGFRRNPNAPRKGRDLQTRVSILFMEAINGIEKEIEIGRIGNRAARKLKIKIPAGIDDGQTIRLSGEGEPGANNGPAGDLYVHMEVAKHQSFERDGDDILSVLNIGFPDAALGVKRDVETVDGPVVLKVPAGTQSGAVLRLRHKGAPRINAGGRGDHLVTIKVLTPKHMSWKQKQLMKDLRDDFVL